MDLHQQEYDVLFGLLSATCDIPALIIQCTRLSFCAWGFVKESRKKGKATKDNQIKGQSEAREIL